jgi:beta-barrel assembly-enhancing protease
MWTRSIDEEPQVMTVRVSGLLRIGALLALGCVADAGAQSLDDLLKGSLQRGKAAESLLNLPKKAPDAAASPDSELARQGRAFSPQSVTEEIQIGEGVAASVLGAAPSWSNAGVQRYVNLVGRTVADQSERRDLPWSFAVLDTPSINAFAAPGGIVLVTRGLYEILETEDELAAVLAHEIAHVNRRHHYNVIKQQSAVDLGASIAGRSLGGTGVEREAMGLLVRKGAEVMARGLDKGAEFEADADATVLAARAGYDSSALLAVLERLAARSAQHSSLELLFKTHPAPADRIREIGAVANDPIIAAAVTSEAADRIKRAGR